MTNPTIHTSDGRSFSVLGIDGGDAPALSVAFNAADAPEITIRVVRYAIDAGVALFVTDGGWLGRAWAAFNVAHVISISCEPFDA